MKFKECIDEVSKAVGRNLSDEEQKEVAKTVGEIITKIQTEGKAGDLNKAALKAIEDYTNDLKKAAFIEKRNAALNAYASIQMSERIKANYAGMYDVGIKAEFEGVHNVVKGAKNSLDNSVQVYKAQYMQTPVSKMAKAGVLDVAKSGKFDEQIFKAMYELSKKNPDQKTMAEFMPEVVEIAKIKNEFLERARMELNDSGAMIGKLEGRVLKRTHDPDAIKLAAGKDVPIGDPKHKKAWVDFVYNRLDWDKSFPGLPEAKRLKALEELYNRFESGIHLKEANLEGTPSGFKGAANLAKKVSKERSLIFKDAQAEWDYYSTFSRGEKLIENFLNEMSADAVNIASMRKFGPNPKANVERVTQNLVKELVDQGKGEEAQKLKDATKLMLESTFPIITGEFNAAARNTLGKTSSMVRKVFRVADLNAAAISGISDVLSGAGILRHTNERTVGSYFKGLYDIASKATEGFKIDTPKNRELVEGLSIMLDTMLPTQVSMYDVDVKTPGAVSKFLDGLFRLNGITYVQDKIKLSTVLVQASKYAKQMDSPFDALSQGTKDWFTKFGITPEEWDIARTIEKVKDDKGIEYFMPDKLRDIPLEKFQNLESVKNAKHKDTALEKARRELFEKFAQSNSELALIAGTEAGAKQKRLTAWNHAKPGTVPGEAVAHLMMYKGFVVNFMDRHLGREMYGYSAKDMSFTEAFTKMWGMDKGGGFLAAMAPASLAMGYTIMTLREALKGKKPREPQDAGDFVKIGMSSLAYTGALGIYTDFLFGDMKNRFGGSAVETLFGPSVRRLSDVVDIFSSARDIPFADDSSREAEKVSNKMLRFAMGNTPGVSTLKNHFATSLAFNYLITYNLMEAMNPGSLKKMEKRTKRELDQEYFVPPSSVIQRGGGFK